MVLTWSEHHPSQRQAQVKKNTTYIARDTIMSLATQAGLMLEEKKGWTLAGSYGTGGARLYIPHTKNVGRIDVSACTVPLEMGVRDLGGESFGNVHQQVDFSLPGEQILENLEKIFAFVKALPKPEKVARKAPAKSASSPSSSPEPVASAPVDPKEARRNLIFAKAQELIAARGLSAIEAVTAAKNELFPQAQADETPAEEPAAS